MDESRLLGRARSGDVFAYRALLEHHQAAALRTADLILRDTAEAEDAVQESFVRAFARLGELREDVAFRGWLLRIVSNEALNRVRSADRRRGAHERAGRASGGVSLAPSAEASVVEFEDRRMLLDAVHRLSEDDRLVIGCRYFLELSQDETAEVLGVPAGTVKSRQSRALGRLRAALSDLENDALEANNV